MFSCGLTKFSYKYNDIEDDKVLITSCVIFIVILDYKIYL